MGDFQQSAYSFCRKSKPIRDIDALLQKEEDLQKAQELANAEAVGAEAAADIEKDAYNVRSAPSMDLCTTEEMMSVFQEYYAGDIKDMVRSNINNTCIEADVDVTANEFALDVSGKGDQVQTPALDFGSTNVG